jgi:hypothetical protein
MATQSITIPASTSGTPCQCGASPTSCCDLTCLVQPRFFCGQLLTDQDLTALLAWTKGRLALSRYRHGWGVVCGLNVRIDPAQSAQLIVGPGYAVNCCGDDTLVCKDTPVNLARLCQPDADPCAALRKPATNDPPKTVPFGGFQIPESDLRVIDLYLNYSEQPSEPVTALGRGTCTQTAPCEYSRNREAFSITPRIGVRDSDPVKTAATNWVEQYEQCMDVIEQFQKSGIQSGSNRDDVRRWLLSWIDKHPLNQFSFVRTWISDQSVDLNTEEITKILFWIVQDCRNSFLQCDCFACHDDNGVPLARVTLHLVTSAAGKSSCEIVQVDSYPPYRRPIHLTCWPAPEGQVNLGRAIWQQLEEARSILAGLGLLLSSEENFTIPSTVSDLANALSESLLVKTGVSCKMQTLDGRVVGFTS